MKIGLVLSAILLFIIACNQTQTTNTNLASNTAVAANLNNSIQAPTTATDELAAARKIYSEQCVKCHKEGGTGGISTIDGKKIKAPNLTTDRQKNEPDAEYVEVIENGEKKDGMPAFKGKISDDDIKNLVKLIRRDFQGKL
ncbi:MAG TPA: cytochrome c [Pyrinomonadaceae bacterium]|nr:cytochrome c [Pyrinomonadaceae bacterium]